MHDPMTQVADVPSYKVRKQIARLLRSRRPAVSALFEVWHHDPSDYDSETCGRDYRKLSHWRHWRLRIPALLKLRRRLFQRCAECGGWSTRKNPVNVAANWDDRHFSWWNSRPNVMHRECSQKYSARVRSQVEHWRKVGYNDGLAEAFKAGVRHE